MLLLVAGLGLLGYAVVRQPAPAAPPDAATSTTPASTMPGSAEAPARTQAPTQTPTAKPVLPTGIVRLTDPTWVARVSEAADIPSRALSAYAGADLYARSEWGCAVGWNTLAAIGLVETEHGTIQGGSIETDGVARPTIVGIALDGTRTAAIADTDGGDLDGDPTWDRAVGPMQFIPGTWLQWGVDGDEDGVVDINDVDDAALTAARYLCQAQGTLDGAGAWIAAVRSYNDDPDYQDRVATAAARYASLDGE